MAYDDGYYFGQAKIVALATKADDEGKTVTVTNGTKTYTGTMADGKCVFTVPGKDRYTIRLGSYSRDIDVSYGECLGVHMAAGYEFVTKLDLSSALSTELGGCKLSYENGAFYATYGSVKKKFGDYGTNALSRVAATYTSTTYTATAEKEYLVYVGMYGGVGGYAGGAQLINYDVVPVHYDWSTGHQYLGITVALIYAPKGGSVTISGAGPQQDTGYSHLYRLNFV